MAAGFRSIVIKSLYLLILVVSILSASSSERPKSNLKKKYKDTEWRLEEYLKLTRRITTNSSKNKENKNDKTKPTPTPAVQSTGDHSSRMNIATTTSKSRGFSCNSPLPITRSRGEKREKSANRRQRGGRGKRKSRRDGKKKPPRSRRKQGGKHNANKCSSTPTTRSSGSKGGHSSRTTVATPTSNSKTVRKKSPLPTTRPTTNIRGNSGNTGRPTPTSNIHKSVTTNIPLPTTRTTTNIRGNSGNTGRPTPTSNIHKSVTTNIPLPTTRTTTNIRGNSGNTGRPTPTSNIHKSVTTNIPLPTTRTTTNIRGNSGNTGRPTPTSNIHKSVTTNSPLPTTRSRTPTSQGSGNSGGRDRGGPRPTARRTPDNRGRGYSKRGSATPTSQSSSNRGGRGRGSSRPTARRTTDNRGRGHSKRGSATPTSQSSRNRGGRGRGSSRPTARRTTDNRGRGHSKRGSATPTHQSRGNNVGRGKENKGNKENKNNDKKLTPREVRRELKNLFKKKVNHKNAKEVARNLTKVFKQSRPKDFSKDDADVAADIMENIVSMKERLNETADEVVDLIDMLMEMNRTALAQSGTAATKIIKALDTLVEYIPLDEDTASKQINKTNIIIQANLVNPKTFQGINFKIKAKKRSRRSVESDTGTEEDARSIKLPQEVLKNNNMSSVRIGFIYYNNNKLFQANTSEGESVKFEPSQAVLSSTVYNANISNLTDPVIIRFALDSGRNVDEIQKMKISRCVYWVESERQWSNYGCSLCANQSSKHSVECCCNHLTSFAVLFSPVKGKSSKDSDVHARALSIISYVGCVISIFGVVLTFLTYSMFRHLRKTNQQPILMNLCVAIALLLILFVAGINSTNNRLGCQIIAVLLHYFTLVTVLWMGIEAYNLYLQIVKVMAIYHRKFMLKAAVVGWGVPLLVVMATVIAAVVEYKQKDGSVTFYYGNDQMCVLHNQLYWIISWFGPILVILLLNLVAFFLIIYKLTSRSSMLPVEPKSKHIKTCWTSLAIMFLLGLTWLFGALAISDARIVFEYLFCIFNSLQGFFIFFFHCARIQEVRRQWSFFVSGLGFSHGDSENYQKKSRGVENQASDVMNMRKVQNGCQGNETAHAQPGRKVTVVTMVGDIPVEGCAA